MNIDSAETAAHATDAAAPADSAGTATDSAGQCGLAGRPVTQAPDLTWFSHASWDPEGGRRGILEANLNKPLI